MKSLDNLITDSKLILNESLKADSNYAFYGLALQKAVELGYTSTIVCPILSGSPKEWAHFHAAIINEITFFTALVNTPTCLISGGNFDGTPERNLEFAYTTMIDLRNTHPIILHILDSTGNFSTVTNQNFHYDAEQNTLEQFREEFEKNTKTHQPFRELELRFFLIG